MEFLSRQIQRQLFAEQLAVVDQQDTNAGGVAGSRLRLTVAAVNGRHRSNRRRHANPSLSLISVLSAVSAWCRIPGTCPVHSTKPSFMTTSPSGNGPHETPLLVSPHPPPCICRPPFSCVCR